MNNSDCELLNSDYRFCPDQSLTASMEITAVVSVLVKLVTVSGQQSELTDLFSVFLVLTLKSIWLNILKYKSFNLCHDCQSECWDGCDICGFFKGKQSWNYPPIDYDGIRIYWPHHKKGKFTKLPAACSREIYLLIWQHSPCTGIFC